MTEKKRLDVAVFEKSLAESREKARALIMSGSVYVNNQKETKPGTQVAISDSIEVRGAVCPYVSRGGYKLEKAVNIFNIDLKGKTCIDAGASTGGFTDCMLQNGADKVYAVDVGYGQLAWKLRSDDRVVCLERINVRKLTSENINETVDFISVDVSFISLSLVVPVLLNFLREDGEILCLIKPQFEAGKEKVGKNGVVRDKNVHIEVVSSVADLFCLSGLQVTGVDYSPIKGPKGNIEFLIYGKYSNGNFDNNYDLELLKKVVETAHIGI